MVYAGNFFLLVASYNFKHFLLVGVCYIKIKGRAKALL